MKQKKPKIFSHCVGGRPSRPALIGLVTDWCFSSCLVCHSCPGLTKCLPVFSYSKGNGRRAARAGTEFWKLYFYWFISSLRQSFNQSELPLQNRTHFIKFFNSDVVEVELSRRKSVKNLWNCGEILTMFVYRYVKRNSEIIVVLRKSFKVTSTQCFDKIFLKSSSG